VGTAGNIHTKSQQILLLLPLGMDLDMVIAEVRKIFFFFLGKKIKSAQNQIQTNIS